MTAKQKKNLRKKLYRKRKKLEQSHNNSKLDLTNESFQTSESSRSSANEDDEESKAEEEPETDTSYNVHSKVWKFHAASSSDSEISDSEGQNVKQLKENQAKVRACALKMLTAAFKVSLL